MINTARKSVLALGVVGAVLGMAAPSFAQVIDDNGSSTPNSTYENNYRQQDPSSFYNRQGAQSYGQARAARPAVRGNGPNGQCWISESAGGNPMSGYWGSCSEPGAVPGR